jgi:Domain of Unknown Function (DUF1080)
MQKSLLVLVLAIALDATAADKSKALKPAPKSTAATDGWTPLFDGKSLAGWKTSDFAAAGGVSFEADIDGKPAIVVDQGEVLSGVTYTNPVPRVNYEVTLEGMKLGGSDFFCGLTFPVKDSHATLVLGGWGGGVVGISSIDGSDASENETTKYLKFDKNVWYRVRVRVTSDKLEAWLDDEKIADVELADKKIALRAGEIESAIPLSLSTYQTRAAYRNVKLKNLSELKIDRPITPF